MGGPGRLTDAKKQAFAIYDLILSTSHDRPSSGQTLEQMQRDIANWKAENPALKEIERASSGVHLAFLNHSFGWLKDRTQERSHFSVTSTLFDATLHALNALPKPLPADTVTNLLSDLRNDDWTRCYFPFRQFLSVLRREQITDEMRTYLRSLHFYYAPSPAGKIEKHHLAIRNVIGELLRIEGAKQLDSGRGPWSQIVFDELALKSEITRAGWEALLEHCRSLEQTIPGKKWNKRAEELLVALGEEESVPATLLRWLTLGPTPGQPSEARSPIEDSSYQKGVVWTVSLGGNAAAATVLGDFAIACLRKVRMLGAVSQKVGFACVQALGVMECDEAIAQLSRLRAKVKYSVARRLIEKSLRQAAERAGVTAEDLEDSCIESFGLDTNGTIELALGDAKVRLRLNEDGRVATAWYNGDGKLLKSAPAHVRKAFPKDVQSVAKVKKDLEQTYLVQRSRLEASLASPRTMSMDHWKRYFVDHPLTGFLGRRLIWLFRNHVGSETTGIWSSEESMSENGIRDSSGRLVDLSGIQTVSLWHPLSSDAAELQQWRDCIFTQSIRQPFRQAFREFYQLTYEEQKASMHSNRFAGVVMRQHQLSSLCRARGWEYRLMGTGFDGFNVPSKALPQWNMHVEFYVDIPSDRDQRLRDSGLDEQAGSGINLFIVSDQVRFYRNRHEIPLDEVPGVVYSEIMRDVDLFTSVCAIGEDEQWTDQGDRGIGVLAERFNIEDLSHLVELRSSILSRVLPHTPIAKRCRLQKSWLVVQGQLGTYHIQLVLGGAMLLASPHPRWLNIPRPLLNAVHLDFVEIPMDLDYRSEMILRKAHVLADDWKIDSPELIRQLMPE